MAQHGKKEIEYIVNENGCHICISHAQRKDGHCEIHRNGKKQGIHRYLYEKYYGFIDPDLVVRHKCDVPNCINIEHLELGTHQDNVRDRVERNRSAKGVFNGRAKLTEDNVREIRNTNERNITLLARKYGVDRKAIYNIIAFKTWKHVI